MKETQAYAGRERRSEARAGRNGPILGPFFGLLRWIGSHFRGFHAALGAYLIAGLAAILVSIVIFGTTASLVSRGRTQQLDERILLWLDAHATPWLDGAALEVTALAGVAVVWLVLMLATVFLWRTQHRYSALLLWVSYVGASLINFTLKAMYDRPRPALFEWRTPMAGHSSFPSGHSTTAVAVFASLAYLIVRLEPTRSMRRMTLAIAAIVITLIGASRLYLGVHYPSDVIAGFMVGLAWATFCALGIEAVRYFRTKKPDVGEDEKDIEKGTAPIRDAVT